MSSPIGYSQEPPNSRYFAGLRSGQPSVWMIFVSGFGTRQISFTPSSQICGSGPWRPKWSSAAPVRCPAVPSASTVTLADDVRARLEVAERLVLLAAALVAAADADDAPVLDEQPVGRGLGQDERPARLGQLREIARHLGDRDDPVAVVAERRRRRDPERPLAREQVDALARHLAVGRDRRASCSGRPLNRRRTARGFMTAPESRCEPGCLPLSTSATGTSPRRSAVAGSSSSSWPSRIAQASPAGPPPTIRTPTSIRSSGASVGAAITSSLENGGG